MPAGDSLEHRQQEHYYRTLGEAGRLLEDALHITRAAGFTALSRPGTRPLVTPLPTTEGATWRDVSIRFTSEFQVQITVLGHTAVRNYVDMGFEDRRRQVPDSAWELLQSGRRTQGFVDCIQGYSLERSSRSACSQSFSSKPKAAPLIR